MQETNALVSNVELCLAIYVWLVTRPCLDVIVFWLSENLGAVGGCFRKFHIAYIL